MCRAQMIHHSGVKHFSWSFPEDNITVRSEEWLTRTITLTLYLCWDFAFRCQEIQTTCKELSVTGHIKLTHLMLTRNNKISFLHLL